MIFVCGRSEAGGIDLSQSDVDATGNRPSTEPGPVHNFAGQESGAAPPRNISLQISSQQLLGFRILHHCASSAIGFGPVVVELKASQTLRLQMEGCYGNYVQNITSSLVTFVCRDVFCDLWKFLGAPKCFFTCPHSTKIGPHRLGSGPFDLASTFLVLHGRGWDGPSKALGQRIESS